jgi:hypothetical protein
MTRTALIFEIIFLVNQERTTKFMQPFLKLTLHVKEERLDFMLTLKLGVRFFIDAQTIPGIRDKLEFRWTRSFAQMVVYWWQSVDCPGAQDFYSLNEQIGQLEETEVV